MRKHLLQNLVMAAMVLLAMGARGQSATTLTNSDLPRMFTFEEGSGDGDYLSFANGADAWCIGGATYHDGAQSLYISNDNGVSNNYGTANVYSYAWITVDIQQSGEYEIAFDWKGTGESSYDYMYVYWAPGSVTPTANSTLSGATQIGSRFNQQTSWQHFYGSRVITDGDLGTYKLIFMWRSDGSVFNNPAIAVDNLYFGRLTCPAPTGLTFTGHTNDGATASWTPVGEETQWIVSVNGVMTADSPVSTTTYSFTGLDANSDQHVAIRAYCGAGDTSMALTGTFRTLCENGNCQIEVAPTATYTGSYYTPTVTVYQNGSAISSGYNVRTVDICNGDSLIVILSQMPSSTYYNPSVRVTDVAGTDLFNASINGHSVGDTLVAVANGCPSCLPVQAVYRSTSDAYNTTIHWTDNNTSGLGEYVIYVNGVLVGTVSSDSAYILSTNAMTSYTVSVARVCDVDDTSAFRSVSFLTPCDESNYASLPFSTSFEELNTNESPACWLQVQTGGNPGLGAVFPSAYRWQPNAHTGSVYFEFESSTGNETEVLALPRMENVSTLQLSFYASTTVTRNSFILEAGVIEYNASGDAVFVPVDTVDLYAGPNESWSSSYRVYNVLFNTYTGNGERLAIRTTPTTGAMYTLMIDDFSVIYAGAPVLGPFQPASHTVNVDTNLVLTANLMSGEGVAYTWNSVMVDAGQANIVSQDSNSVTIHYSAGGIDSVSVIASTGFGSDDTAFVRVSVIDEAPVSEFPYTNGFEDGDNLSWRTANAANGWFIGTATAYAGSRSLYVSDVNGTTNTYGNISGNAYAYRTIHFSQAGEYGVSFMWHNNGNNSSYLQTYLTPGEVYPSTSYYSWSALGDELYGHSDWQRFDEVADVDTGVYTLIFRWTNNSTINNPPAAIDSLVIARLTCSSVGNLEAHNVYAHEADIVWTPRSGETEWWVVVDDEEGYSVSSDSLHLSGFDGETSHTVSVFAICGPGDTSFASTVSFTTTIACMPVSNIVATDITGTTATVSWTPGGTETAWRISLGGGDTIEVSGTPSYSFSGLTPMTEYNIVVFADCGSDDGSSEATATSFFTLCDDGTCNITLQMTDSYGDGWNNGALLVFQSGVEVGSGTITSGNAAATATIPVCSSMPVSVVFVAGNYAYEMSATIFSGSGVELYSFAPNSMSSSNDGDTLVTTATPCSGCPQPGGLEVSATTSSSITISWADMDTLTSFVVSVDGGAWTPVSDTTYTATGLNPATIYNFYVRTLCGPGDTSDARSISASTECVSVTAFPLTVDFENAADLLCWSQNGPGEWRVGTGDNNSSTGAHSGTSNVLITHSSTGNVTKLISPVLDLSAQSSVELTFWHLQRVWAGDQDQLNVYYRAQTSDDWTLLESFTSDIATWTADTIALPNPSATCQVAFEMVDGYGYGVAIDDLRIASPGAAPLQYYTVSATSANAVMGSASVSPSGSVQQGTSVTATAVPADGYLFVNWTIASTVASTDNPYTFTLVDNTALVANFEAVPEEPCDVPSNVAAGNVSFSSAAIGWTAPEGQNLWEIQLTGAGTSQVVPATTNPFTLAGLSPAIEYTVAVRAICSATSQSLWSTPATFTTLTCQPVTGILVSNRTSDGATISWSAPSGIASFELEYGPSGFAQGANSSSLTLSATSCTLSGLDAATAYDVYLRSICHDGVYSAWSNPLTFETLDQQPPNAIDDIASASILLFPNPASSSVSLSGIDGQATVTIVDMNGREVHTQAIKHSSNQTLTLDLTPFPRGTYFLRITTERYSVVRKLIVQ